MVGKSVGFCPSASISRFRGKVSHDCRVSHSSSSPPPRSGAPAKSASGPSSSGGTSSAFFRLYTCNQRLYLYLRGCIGGLRLPQEEIMVRRVSQGAKKWCPHPKTCPRNHFCPPLVHASWHGATQTRSKPLESRHFFTLTVGRPSRPSSPVKRLANIEALRVTQAVAAHCSIPAVQSTWPMARCMKASPG